MENSIIRFEQALDNMKAERTLLHESIKKALATDDAKALMDSSGEILFEDWDGEDIYLGQINDQESLYVSGIDKDGDIVLSEYIQGEENATYHTLSPEEQLEVAKMLFQVIEQNKEEED